VLHTSVPFRRGKRAAKVATVSVKIVVALPPAYQAHRRSMRFKIDVPLRVILQKTDATLIREGRGRELSEHGMNVMVGIELGVGQEVEIEFTLPYVGQPIRVSSAVRNREGYCYGCEFIPNDRAEQIEVARLRRALQSFAGEKSS
jgi:PilZ domain